MRFRFIIISLALASSIIPCRAIGQGDLEQMRMIFPEGKPLTVYDSLGLISLPELAAPADLRSRWLPDIVDNSQLPYLRPVFSQYGASCGQAAAVGYNFTFETDSYRNLPADTIINQYPTHFTWNFMNGGDGWYGVSYFHSFEILKYCGCMNVADYGGYYYDNGIRWISGYDVYHNAMSNRIDQAYTIRTDTEEGILTVKSWVYDHLGTTETGGVASFYSNPPYGAVHLNDTTPEGGKYVVTAFYPAATHAMTIVGYNDSIRWDYNGDGQYTNDIDLDGDSRLTPRDWEIGGFKVVNSYGNFLDSGFYYMMYKVAAEDFNDGGIWNQCVHVLDVSENYQPLLTFKVSLTHERRGMVKVTAGVSADTADLSPAWVMDFPIFDYQGGDHYMQGEDSALYLRTIEFGLDVTPLLSHLEPGEPARFFLIVDENDPINQAQGSVDWFSLWDYTGTPGETVCSQAPLELVGDGRTILMIDHATAFDPVAITTQDLPPFIPGEPYAATLEAAGGSSPYSWDLVRGYERFLSDESLPASLTQRLMPNIDNDTIVAVPLPFDFPFYGHLYDTVYAHVDGYLIFKEEQLPWPYSDDERLFLKSNRMIAPLANAYFIMVDPQDGVWYEADTNMARFIWKMSDEMGESAADHNCGLTIYPSGEIGLYTGSILNPGDLRMISGISDGDPVNYMMGDPDDQECFESQEACRFIPSWTVPGMTITSSGSFQGTAPSGDTILDLTFRVTDSRRISATRKLPFTSGPWIGLLVGGVSQETALFGDTAVLDLSVKNFGVAALDGLTIRLTDSSPFCQLIDSLEVTGTVPAGDSLLIPDALSLGIASDVPDQFPIILTAWLESGPNEWKQQFILDALAPLLRPERLVVEDGDDHILDPGETAPMLLRLVNSGHTGITSVDGTLASLDERIEIIGSPQLTFGDIPKSHSAEAMFELSADSSVPTGFNALLTLEWASAEGLSGLDTLSLRIGRVPVLVLDLDPNQHSGPAIDSVINGLGVIAEYSREFPSNPSLYHSIFICLGIHFSNHVLSWSEGELLNFYLQDGGRIYMESRETWLTDPLTPLQPMFNISAQDELIMMNSITGTEGTFTVGMTYVNSALHPFNFFYIDPVSPAFTIFSSVDDGRSCAVAYDQGTYRTIGTIFEFGALVDGELPSTREELMKKYFEFFGIYIPPVGITEDTQMISTDRVRVSPNPSGSRFDFRLDLEQDSKATLEIYSSNGALIQTVIREQGLRKGTHKISWAAPDFLPAGIYIYRIYTTEHSYSGKLALLK